MSKEKFSFILSGYALLALVLCSTYLILQALLGNQTFASGEPRFEVYKPAPGVTCIIADVKYNDPRFQCVATP